jgi:hypothetical protein
MKRNYNILKIEYYNEKKLKIEKGKGKEKEKLSSKV